jgi:hypothetical protein
VRAWNTGGFVRTHPQRLGQREAVLRRGPQRLVDLVAGELRQPARGMGEAAVRGGEVLHDRHRVGQRPPVGEQHRHLAARAVRPRRRRLRRRREHPVVEPEFLQRHATRSERVPGPPTTA